MQIGGSQIGSERVLFGLGLVQRLVLLRLGLAALVQVQVFQVSVQVLLGVRMVRRHHAVGSLFLRLLLLMVDR